MTPSLINDAREFAFKYHEGQFRKGKEEPFTNHLVAVAEIVSKLTTDERLIAGAYLHDVVEDTPATLEQIAALFGEKVARLVALESENKEPSLAANHTWRKRKETQLKVLRELEAEERDVYYIALADKLANSQEMLRDYEVVGMALWQRFNNPNPEEHYWYYRSFAEIIGTHPILKKSQAYDELLATIQKLWGDTV